VFARTNAETTVSGTLNGAPYHAVEPVGNTISRFSISHGVNIWTATGLMRRRWQKSPSFPDGRINPYAGIGFGFVINHPESRIGKEFFDRWQFGGLSWQVLAGIDYKLSSSQSFFAEYKFTDYHARVDVAQNGRGEAHLRTHHIVIGSTVRL
jgi:hypothetical protein